MALVNPKLQNLAKSYNEKYGLPAHDFSPSTLTENPENSRQTAQAYAGLVHDPHDPAVKHSYDALKQEIAQQYEHVQGHVKMEPSQQQYPTSKHMVHDVAKNDHLYYYPTDQSQMDRTHPLSEIHPGTGLPYNDMFRAVHDYFGHAMHGHQFGAVGEQRAWHEHAKMFSPVARKALSTETHGQNSWVNYGPNAHLPPTERPFAEQKAALLPEHLHPAKLARIPDPIQWGGETRTIHGMNRRYADFGTEGGKYSVTLDQQKGNPNSSNPVAQTAHVLGEHGHPLHDLAFTQLTHKDGYGITGAGHGKAVFRHVTGLLNSAINDHGHKAVSFSANELSRAQLYRWFTARAEKLNPDVKGFEMSQDPDYPDGKSEFLLLHKDLHPLIPHIEEATGRSVTPLHDPKAQLARTPQADRGLARAVPEMGTKNAKLRVALAKHIIKESGLHGNAWKSLFIGGDSRPSVLAAIQHSGEPDVIPYVAAWYGMLAQEPRLTVFHADPSGSDVMHSLTTGMKPSHIQRALQITGLPNAVVTGNKVHLFDEGGRSSMKISRLAGALNARHTTHQGVGHRIGSGTGSDSHARTAYRDIIQRYEQAGGNQGQAASQPTVSNP